MYIDGGFKLAVSGVECAFAKKWFASMPAKYSQQLASLSASTIGLTLSLAHAQTFETLYSFQGRPDGADPKGALLIGQAGALYGTTFTGGTSRGPKPPCTVSLDKTATAPHLWQRLAMSSTGVLYGTTSAGGSAGKGAVFAIVP